MKSALMFCLKASLVIGCLLSYGCEKQESVSDEKGFIANNDSGNNYLLAFLGDSNGIPGTLQDIPKMSRVFTAANGFNFTMPGPYSGGWQHPSNEIITAEVGKAAKAMLEKDLIAWKNMQRGGTLFIYFTSHGAPDGSTSTGGGNSSIQFAEVANAIRSARGEYPVERLVVFFDTCFSGQNVVGSTSISRQSGGLGLIESTIPDIAKPKSTDPALESFVANSMADANSVKGFYKSAIFIGASRPSETSGDGSDGGVGTEAFIQAITAAKGGSLSGTTSKNNTGGLESLLGSIGGQGQQSDSELGLTQSETLPSTGPTATSSTGGAGTGKGSATATIKAVLQNMVSNASGQTPVFCVEPRELADDFFFDPPEGYLPVNPVNALKTGADNRECSR